MAYAHRYDSEINFMGLNNQLLKFDLVLYGMKILIGTIIGCKKPVVRHTIGPKEELTTVLLNEHAIKPTLNVSSLYQLVRTSLKPSEKLPFAIHDF